MNRADAIRRFRAFGYRIRRTRRHTILEHPGYGHVVTMTSSNHVPSRVVRGYRTIWRRLERGEAPEVGMGR